MYVDPDPECNEEGWGTARSMAVPAAAVAAFGGGYVMRYGLDQYLTYTELLGPYGVWLQFAVIAAVVVLHETLHGLAYVAVSGLSWSEIEVEFTVDTGSAVDPVHHSVHPTRPIRRRAYYLGVAAPGVMLGFLPATVGLVSGNPLAMFVGIVGILLISTDVNALITAWRRPSIVAVSDPAY